MAIKKYSPINYDDINNLDNTSVTTTSAVFAPQSITKGLVVGNDFTLAGNSTTTTGRDVATSSSAGAWRVVTNTSGELVFTHDDASITYALKK